MTKRPIPTVADMLAAIKRINRNIPCEVIDPRDLLIAGGVSMGLWVYNRVTGGYELTVRDKANNKWQSFDVGDNTNCLEDAAKCFVDFYNAQHKSESHKSSCSMQKKKESLSKKSESTDLKGLPISEENFEKIVKAYCKASSGEGSVPELVEINKVVPVVMDNGEVEGYAVEFAYYGTASGVGMTSYAVVYGDPSKNRDGDTIAFLHNWDSVDNHWLLGAKQVDSEEVAEKDWELANDYIKPSEVIGESHKKSEGIEDQPKEVQKMVQELAEETGNDVADAQVNEEQCPGIGFLVTFGDEEYYCYEDYDMARGAAFEGISDLLDDIGIEGINFDNIGGIEQFLDVDWFKDAQREDAEFYVSDIKKSEPERYKEEFGDIDEEDAVEKYLEESCEEDSIEWYINNFGKDEFNKCVKENGVLDYQKLTRAILDADGPANELASYDGKEIELPCGYYCYRHN